MKAVAIVDTSILCNVLDIPHMNSDGRLVHHQRMGKNAQKDAESPYFYLVFG